MIYPSVIYQKKEETKAFKNPLNAHKKSQGFGRYLRLNITHWFCYRTTTVCKKVYIISNDLGGIFQQVRYQMKGFFMVHLDLQNTQRKIQRVGVDLSSKITFQFCSKSAEISSFRVLQRLD